MGHRLSKCRGCFFSLVQTRFKKTLEPHVNPKPDGPRRKALKASGSLVIGFSGGTCSTTLLDVVAKTYFSRPERGEPIRGGTEHPRNSDRSIWKGRPVVCYVDVCGASPGVCSISVIVQFLAYDFSEATDQTETIRTIVEGIPGSPFEFVPLKLEDSFDPSWWTSVGGNLADWSHSLGLDISNEGM